MKTLLAIGDIEDWDSYLKFYRQKSLLKQHKVRFESADYDAVLNDDLPEITTDTVVVFLFFPFRYWDTHIEPRKYSGLYGNREFYSKWKTFWKTVNKKIREQYKDKKIRFVNAPENIPQERDKASTSRLLSRAGIQVPHAYRSRDPRKIMKLLNQGTNLFIKVRYGSMGKGITYLEKGEWHTNFGFRGNKIMNKHSDYGWKFRKVTGNNKFLRQLLKEDIVVEEAIPRWLIKGKQFDLRCLIFYGKILYMYPRSNDVGGVTNNVSQGASSETMRFLKDLPEALIKKTEKTALAAAKTLGLNFAGVDILLDSRKQVAVVIELNAFPGFPKVRTFNLGRHLVRTIGERQWK